MLEGRSTGTEDEYTYKLFLDNGGYTESQYFDELKEMTLTGPGNKSFLNDYEIKR